MEERFAVLATTDFNKAVSEEVGAIKALFNEQAKAFDGKIFSRAKMHSVLRACGLSFRVRTQLMNILSSSDWL